ncbi:imelysin family protein [Oceanobacter mangrovi]|uniref:imelysin family protein n=1 Tax=Oceanobacter mangrovi TaxID=2862510 RepID=UPI001C8E8CF7|nr:imelysin family protein [Oceanobacter mangrovi]
MSLLKPCTLATVVGLAGLMLTGCGGSRANDEPTLSEGSIDKALEQMVDNTIIPAATGFAAEVTAFSESAEDFCAAPDSETLATLQQQWISMENRWYQLLPFNFGPLNDDVVFPAYQYIDSFRVRGTNYTSTVRTQLASWIAADSTLNADFFDGKTFQYVGVLALEVLVFEDADRSQLASDIVADFEADSRRCDALQGLAGSLQNKADYVVNGWTVDHLDSGSSYRTMLLAGETDDGSEPLTELITSVQEFYDYLTQRDTVSNIAQLADSSWQAMSASIDITSELLEGTDATTVSLFQLMEIGGNSTDVETVRSNLTAAREAISAQDSTTFNSLAASLDGNFKREIPDGLDVSLGINFSDGD